MKMKGQLDSAQPLKKHKTKSKKNELKKKKQAKLETKKQAKEKKDSQPEIIVSAEVMEVSTAEIQTPKKSKTKKSAKNAPEDMNENIPESPVVIEPEVTEAPESSSTTRQRASKSLEPMTKEEQLVAINLIIKRLLLDEMTQGAALRELRVGVLGIRQDAYTKLCGVSRKTLSEIENDKGNYTSEIINKVFQPFEIKVGLVPTSSQLLAAILTN